jgi:CRISPR/Cas system-associated exonuclease Cas4 (RecB family)
VNTKDFVFSASSFKEYVQCGLKFKFHRIDKLTPTDVASHHRWFGTLVHSLIYTSLAVPTDMKDMVMRDEIDTEFPLTIFDAVWDEVVTDDEIIKAVQKDLGPKPVGRFMTGKIVSLGKNNEDTITQEELDAGWREEAKRMIANGVASVQKIHKIVELEKKLRWMYKKHKFLGYSDIVALDENGKYEYHDFKTTWDKPGKYLVGDFQFFSYSYALKRLYGLDYYPAGNYIHLRSGDTVRYEVTPEIERKMDSLVTTSLGNLQSNIFFDAYGSPLCGYCDFRHICYGEDKDVWKTSGFKG